MSIHENGLEAADDREQDAALIALLLSIARGEAQPGGVPPVILQRAACMYLLDRVAGGVRDHDHVASPALRAASESS